MLRAKIEPNELTKEKVLKLVTDYIASAQYQQYLRLQRYYEGSQDILNRQASPANPEINNQIVNNFPGYIVDVNIGYFMGNPVSYTAPKEKEDYLMSLQEVFDLNDEQDKNMILSKTAGIKGHVYELLYVDEEALVRFCAIQPENLILIYSTLVEPSPLAAIRFWVVPDLFGEDDEDKLFITLYTADFIIDFEGTEDDVVQVDQRQNRFGDVPIVEYQNNDERQGDFEKVISLIDAYDKSQSDLANDFESFTDAFLVIRNMSGTTDEDLQDMKRKRVILVDDDGEADWLVKQMNDTAQENYKVRIQEDIHRFSLTPNLTDDKFAGNVTGVALQYKLWGLEQKASQKERKFKKALQRRIKLITNFLTLKGKDIDYQDITITFSRNAPQVLTEMVETVTKLRDFLSDETLMSLLPMVDDPAEEKDRREAERQYEGAIDLDEFSELDTNNNEELLIDES